MKKLIIFFVGLLLLSSCSNNKIQNEQISSYNQLDNKTIGCVIGSAYEPLMPKYFPNSKISLFNSRSELILGLRSNKIDAFILDDCTVYAFLYGNDDMVTIEDNDIIPIDNGFGFSNQANELKNEFNVFLEKCRDEGYLEILKDKWVVNYNDNVSVEKRDFNGKNGTINVVTTIDGVPMSFLSNNTYQGYEIELLERFCDEYGYIPNYQNTNLDSMLIGLKTNKYDVALSNLSITEERKKAINFSNPTYLAHAKLVVLNQSNASNSKLNNVFYTIFIEENRGLLLLSGLGVTCLIVALSILFGTIFGFLFYMLCKNTNDVVRKMFDYLSFVVSRIPIIVILMILFYVVFASTSFSGVVISIIGFSFITSLSIYSMLNTGMDAIDKGQTEAALALGYTENQALYKFILPQALRIIMPSYKNEIVSLIKSSSIVGYITVQDLTRVSDIIRSRTFEAFIPLIVTAVVYFIMAWFLSLLADYFQKKYLPNEKSKDDILKKYK